MSKSSTAVGPGFTVLDPEGFRAVLLRERALSDRSRLPFTVLAFTLEREAEPAVRERLLHALAGRLRETDLIGWLQEGELAALLRYSSVAEALRVAAEVRAILAPDAPPCRAFGHPPFEFEHAAPALESAAEPAARDSGAPTLPVPVQTRPVVEREIGAVSSS